MTSAAKIMIHVELLDDGCPCWRPVEAKHVAGDLYRIIGAPPEDEVWAF